MSSLLVSVKTVVLSATRLTQIANEDSSRSRPARTSTTKRTIERPREWRLGAAGSAGPPARASLLRSDGQRVVLQREDGMERPHRALDVGAVDHAGDLDRRGGDHLEVDPLARERAEHLRRDPRMRPHPRPDQRHLSEV